MGGFAVCDTLVALGNATRDGSVIFAKNSDRQPNEPHIMIHVPRKTYSQGSKLKCTYIEVEQVSETYEVLLLKPSWIWGAEMGANEFGLNIGNEAVFTKEPQGEPKLLGMDLLRLALERCQNCQEALDLIIDLLARYGQGGNCGYEKPFTYHNSFLIADCKSAWVLETAGEYWAAQKVSDIRCISNRLTIGADYDLAHPNLVGHAIAKGWCRSEQDFHFARCYSNPLITQFSGSAQRLDTCQTRLDAEKGNITVQTMMDILRHHEPRIAHDPHAHSSLKSVCMHGGFVVGDHTTGSYVASINDTLPTYWLTGSSTPCISTFKPYWLPTKATGPVFSEKEEEQAIGFWKSREKFHHMVVHNQVKDLNEYLKCRDVLEKRCMKEVEALDLKTAQQEELQALTKSAINDETALVNKTVQQNLTNPPQIKGNPYYRHYWRNQMRKLGN